MSDETTTIYDTVDRNLYRRGDALYDSSKILKDTSTIEPQSIGDGSSGGNTEMVQGALQSGAFQTGVQGWKIDAEGNAEFNDGTFRGTFILGGALETISDITLLQTAIDSVSALGGGTVSLVPDTYNATTSFTIPSGVVVDGNGATIDFGGGAYQFLIQGTGAYSTGTVAVNFGSGTVTGTGTTWTAAMVGQSILIGDFWYTITARASNTSITISPSFQAPNVSGVTYVIATTVDGAGVQNITLTNSSGTLLKFRYCNGLFFSGVGTTVGGQGVDGDDSANFYYIDSSFVDSCTVGMTLDNVPFIVIDNSGITNITGGTGLAINGVSNSSIGVISLQAITGVGMKFTNCYNLGFINFSIIECTSHGIEFVSGNNDVDLISGYINTTGGDGIKLTATSDRIRLESQSISNYSGYGINIAAATCDTNVIISPSYGGGGSGTLNNLGTGTVILGDDTAYAASWNGDQGTPTKNAVYDEIQTVISLIPAAGANTTLSNLGTVSLNSSLLFQTTLDVGSTTKPARDLYLYGSGTYGTTSLKLTGTPTGARVVTFPDSSTTIPIASQLITFAGLTTGRTITFPDASITVARIDAGQTFTGVQTMTSPVMVTSIDTSSVSFTAFAGATTLMTIGGTGAAASSFFPSTLDASSSITGAIRTSGGISAAKSANIGTTLTVGTGYQIGGAAASNKILKGNGTNFVASTETYAAPGASGNVMTSDGNNWTSAAAAGGGFSFQTIPILGNATDTIVSTQFLVTSNTTGSVMFVAFVKSSASTTAQIYRLVKDSISANYYITHTTTLTITAATLVGLACTSTKVYVSCQVAAADSLIQYAIADLSGVATMTFSGTVRRGSMFSDGTDLYIRSTAGSSDKFTISGTTATNAATNSYTGTMSTNRGVICNGTNVWSVDDTNSALASGGTFTVNKYALAGGAIVSSTTIRGNIDAYTGVVDAGRLFMGSSTMLGISYGYNSVSAAAVTGILTNLLAITLP